MKIGLLCIGDELLKGSTVNTNLASIGAKLLENGLTVDFSVEIRDNDAEITDALEEAMKRADVIITSGGLGPTADDMTKEVVARRLQLSLVPHAATAFAIRRFWKVRHKDDPPGRVMNQSLIPNGAEVIENKNGTAPGLILHTGKEDVCPDKTIILLPGPPGEIVPMFENDVLPRLLDMASGAALHTKLFLVCGVGESEVEDRMLPIISRTHPLSVAYCATHDFVKLFLSSTNMDSLGSAIASVRSEFGNQLLKDRSTGVADDVVKILKSKKKTLATAESCTGG